MTVNKEAKSARKSRETTTPELLGYAELQRTRLRRCSEVRANAEAEFELVLRESRGGENFFQERQNLKEDLLRAHKELQQRKVTRLKVSREFDKRLKAFEEKYRSLTNEAWLKMAAKAPTVYEMYRALYSEEPPRVIHAQVLYHDGFIFQHHPKLSSSNSGDTSSTSQAVTGPIDVSATSFSLQITEDHTDVVAFSPDAMATPSSGSFSLDAWAGSGLSVPGVSSGRALVGTEFTFDPGFTQFTVSADINWNFNLSTFVFLGVAGCGCDLVLRVEPGGGAAPVEQLQSLASLIAPGLWGSGTDGMGSSTVILNLALSDPASEDLKVFAGAAVHAEVDAVGGSAGVLVTGNVTRIGIHAQ